MVQDQGVGRQVKRLREERGWSQAKLAVEADMSVSGVSMIENGQRNLTTATLGKLARAFGVEVADLFPKAQSPLPLEGSGQREASFEEVVGSSPEERQERAEALARAIGSMAVAYRNSLSQMTDAPAGELFCLLMQASLTHVGAWHIAEDCGYTEGPARGQLEDALEELSRAAEEIRRTTEAAEAREELPEGVAWLAAYQRRTAS